MSPHSKVSEWESVLYSQDQESETLFLVQVCVPLWGKGRKDKLLISLPVGSNNLPRSSQVESLIAKDLKAYT